MWRSIRHPKVDLTRLYWLIRRAYVERLIEFAVSFPFVGTIDYEAKWKCSLEEGDSTLASGLDEEGMRDSRKDSWKLHTSRSNSQERRFDVLAISITYWVWCWSSWRDLAYTCTQRNGSDCQGAWIHRSMKSFLFSLMWGGIILTAGALLFSSPISPTLSSWGYASHLLLLWWSRGNVFTR